MGGTVYAVAGGKGGVGKTTTAVNLAAALQAAGIDVAAVDADLGTTNLGEMIGIDSETSVYDVLADRAPVRAAEATGPGGITVVAGERDLGAFGQADPANLRGVLATLRERHDVVVADTGAGLSHASLVPYGAADGVVLVTTPDDVAVADTAKTADLVDRVDGTVLGAVLTRTSYDTDTEAIADRLDAPLLGTVPEASDVAGDEPMVLTAPDSVPAEAYRRIGAAMADRSGLRRADGAGPDAPTGTTGD